jgi:proton-translocating NADH-quinone oxidoreductase chain M
MGSNPFTYPRKKERKKMRLRSLIVIPVRGSVAIWRVGKSEAKEGRTKKVGAAKGGEAARTRALWITGRVWIRSLGVRRGFDGTAAGYQMNETVFTWKGWGAQVSLGVDGLSLYFVRLTTRRTPLCLRASREGIQKYQTEYYASFVRMEGRILAVFLVTDLLWFYVSFEAVLIPMFIRIGVWGSRARKVRAAYFFFRYTLGGSVRRLTAILYRQYRFGTTDRVSLRHRTRELEPEVERILWLACFASMAVKVPMVPVHIWLPEAHVEAPTGGSVILAGILLKLGTYGMRRRLIPRFPQATRYFTPRVYARAVVAVVYTSRTAIRQSDRKRIIAYASVAHMNLTLVGLFSLTQQGVEGAVLQMISHGLVAGALFMIIGVRYDRYHTRMVVYYGGRAQTMPRFATVFRFFTMANIALPGTSAFVGEFRIMVGIMQTNPIVAVLSSTGMVLGGAYSLWLYNRVAYGNLKTRYVGEERTDINRRERRMFMPLIGRTRRLGRYPARILDNLHVSCAHRIEHVRVGTQ